MPKIRAFRGIRYNTEAVNMPGVFCPPYDVILPDQVDSFYKKSPHNAIRLVLGKQLPKDTKSDNRYTRARDFYNKWLQENILKEDAKPAVYYHEHTYTVGDKTFTRHSIVASVKIDDDGNIIPHESTHKAPKLDRLRLMDETNINFSCVFGIYSDPEKTVEKKIKPLMKEPLWEASLSDGNQRFFKIENQTLIKLLTGMFIDKKILIADGHHRYETARIYRDRMRTVTGKMDGKQNFDYVMMHLCNIDEGITILPTHRVIIDSMGVGLVDLEYKLKEMFNMLPYDNKKVFLDGMRKGGKGYIGLRVKGIPRYYMLQLHDDIDLKKYMPDDMHPLLKRLDVMILQSCILEPVLGIDPSSSAKRIEYMSNYQEAIEMVEKEKADIAFLMNPSTIGDVLEIAEAGLKMPQKSTFFYPKTPTGLVFHSLE